MDLKILTPRKALNKAYLKIKPHRSDIENFKTHLTTLLDSINEKESEEFHKNLVTDFLKKTYYGDRYFINTKGRNDLVIHNGKTAKSNVGVIIEAKSPVNKAEMISVDHLNKKAFQELVLYYLRERITLKNIEIKHLIATNIYEWFIFDVQTFDRLFAQNKALVKKFQDFEAGRLAETKTDFFYSEIAASFIAEIQSEIQFTYFDFRNYEKPLRNDNKKDDHNLIALFKILSPEHLLKLPFANDSNSLDKAFYSEFLHIIGLTETSQGGKKLIERPKPKDRNSGTLLEGAIIQLDSLDIINRLRNVSQYGENSEERHFNVALELVITWINRILFLKLMEAQLIKYNKDASFSFLNFEKIRNYDDLNGLFFQVLAKRKEDRIGDVAEEFKNVPYLNSSLFEPADIERNSIYISNLKDDKEIPVFGKTVLKDEAGKRKTGKMTTLEYLFEFLNAYDFSSEGSEEIQEENKTLINASVLGLIFEKINGYKDGSFFTPGFVTMYMAREVIRRAAIQKFNETKGWDCQTIEELYNKIDDVQEANIIVNSLKICDPAVGSGHFLVSALNEMIALKNDLKILQDRNGLRLKEYQVEVVNDELIVTDEDGELFEYHPANSSSGSQQATESQRIQETLFHEKQTIIENCLFGVDINPNSVKICRLRLWIELLKNSYYKDRDNLETLPNIDINIKWGNSLVSRFSLDADLKQALKGSKWTIDSYRNTVVAYRNAQDKHEKHEMDKLISTIKSDFESHISLNDPRIKKLQKLSGELFNLTNQPMLFEMTAKEKAVWNKRIKTLTAQTKQLEGEIADIKANRIYDQAFEWRFEFPEVLNNEGDFVGFDVVIANPPYIQLQKMGEESVSLGKMGFQTFARTGDVYSLFYELGYDLLKQDGTLIFITSNKWMRAGYGEATRKFFIEKTNPVLLIDFGGVQIFESATVDTNILMLTKETNQFKTKACVIKDKEIENLSDYVRQHAVNSEFPRNGQSWVVLSEIEQRIKAKIEAVGTPLKDWDINIYRGILTGYNEAFIINGETKDRLIAEDQKSAEIIRPILRGRDIKRYGYDFADLWLINVHNGIKEKGINPINIDDYGAIKRYLDQFFPQLEQRADKGVTPYNLRNCAYLEDFLRPKIVYPDIMRMPSKEESLEGYPYLYFDRKCFFVEATNFMIVGENIELLFLFLVSDLGFFTFSKFYSGPQFDSTGFRYKKAYIENSYVPILNPNDTKMIKDLGLTLTEIADMDELNKKWYEILDLTEDEVKYVSNYKRHILIDTE